MATASISSWVRAAARNGHAEAGAAQADRHGPAKPSASASNNCDFSMVHHSEIDSPVPIPIGFISSSPECVSAGVELVRKIAAGDASRVCVKNTLMQMPKGRSHSFLIVRLILIINHLMTPEHDRPCPWCGAG